MLVEVKMTDGEKIRLEADKYSYTSDGEIIRVERAGRNTLFNADYVMYIGRVDNLYGGDEV